MNYLVTGGAGFIGANFIHFLLEKYKEANVYNLDKLTYAANLNNLKDVENGGRYKFIHGDIADKSIVRKIMEKCDVVVNFAAETHVDNSIESAESFIHSNIVGTYTLLDVAKEVGIEKYLQISTDEVYGSTMKGSFSEEDNLDPSSPYSASKASADLLALSYFKTHNMPILITRCTNNYGPFQHREKLIPKLIERTIKNENLPIYGSGKQIRDWLYVRDHCSAIDTVLNYGEFGQVYNIGADEEKTNIEIAEKILEFFPSSKSEIVHVEDRKGHDFRYSLTTDKIKKLGWKKEYEFKKGIENTITWYKNQNYR